MAWEKPSASNWSTKYKKERESALFYFVILDIKQTTLMGNTDYRSS